MLEQNQDIRIAGVSIGSGGFFNNSRYITIGFIVVLALLVVLSGGNRMNYNGCKEKKQNPQN
jgi:hypothetical protein